MLFDREPFQYGGVFAKERGLNWEGLDRDGSPTVAAFLSKATSPDAAARFASVTELVRGEHGVAPVVDASNMFSNGEWKGFLSRL